MDTKQIQQIFKENLKQNDKQKLSYWLYAECLELASALMAVELQPTKQHFKEVHEELADVKILLEQYFIFHEISSCIPLNLFFCIPVPIQDNYKLANLLSTQGYFLTHTKSNYPAAQIVLKIIQQLETKKYASPEIKSFYNFKIKRLEQRLQSGEFTQEAS